MLEFTYQSRDFPTSSFSVVLAIRATDLGGLEQSISHCQTDEPENENPKSSTSGTWLNVAAPMLLCVHVKYINVADIYCSLSIFGGSFL